MDKQTIENHSRRKLATLAVELGCRLGDLLNWYQDDFDSIAIMPADQLRFIVNDYLQNRDFYLKQHETSK